MIFYFYLFIAIVFTSELFVFVFLFLTETPNNHGYSGGSNNFLAYFFTSLIASNELVLVLLIYGEIVILKGKLLSLY